MTNTHTHTLRERQKGTNEKYGMRDQIHNTDTQRRKEQQTIGRQRQAHKFSLSNDVPAEFVAQLFR